MKAVKRVMLILGVLLLGTPTLSAQEATTDVYPQITSLVGKYQAERGVKSLVCDDGMMLKTVKMMLRKEFGKEFVEGIKAFGIIFYGNAQKGVADAIVGKVEQIAATLQQINIDDKIKPEAKARGFIRLSDDKQTLTDLLIIMSAPTPKLIYFHGIFSPDNINYKR